jgi:two-component system, OmpR family, sensor histidine kinase VanS
LSKKNPNFKRALSFRILTRFFIAVSVYSAIMVLLFLIAREFFGQFTWYGTELLYGLLSTIDNNFIQFFIIVLGSGYLVIFLYYWMKTLGYLDNIIKATEGMYKDKEQLIELPAELKEVEYQMNQIRIDINQKERAAKEAEQRKNDLVVYLAHDLKTPLTSVIGYLILLRDEKQISPELRDKYLSISLEKAERLEELINEFFEITRFNLTNLTLELSKINLTRMLEQITYEFQPQLREKNLNCVIDAEPEILIKCDVNKMQRVFDNLIRNAINYSFPDRMIKITASRTEEGIRLSFLNYGNTIPPEKLERVFEQFYRLDTARTTKTGGAGLGLAIAKEIVELHKGKIYASSKDEVIEFVLILPVLS